MLSIDRFSEVRPVTDISCPSKKKKIALLFPQDDIVPAQWLPSLELHLPAGRYGHEIGSHQHKCYVSLSGPELLQSS